MFYSFFYYFLVNEFFCLFRFFGFFMWVNLEKERGNIVLEVEYDWGILYGYFLFWIDFVLVFMSMKI